MCLWNFYFDFLIDGEFEVQRGLEVCLGGIVRNGESKSLGLFEFYGGWFFFQGRILILGYFSFREDGLDIFLISFWILGVLFSRQNQKVSSFVVFVFGFREVVKLLVFVQFFLDLQVSFWLVMFRFQRLVIGLDFSLFVFGEMFWVLVLIFVFFGVNYVIVRIFGVVRTE